VAVGERLLARSDEDMPIRFLEEHGLLVGIIYPGRRPPLSGIAPTGGASRSFTSTRIRDLGF
jgi:hypothetical protein